MQPRLATSEELYQTYLAHPRVRIDSRLVEPDDLFVALPGERVDGNSFAATALASGAAFAIVDDPAVVVDNDDRYLLVADSLTALQELASRHRAAFRTPVLAITGSNGKTTTKELVAAVMSRQYRVHATPGNYNNHIGLPLTILGTPPDTEFLILEMGANHQGEIAELCRIGRPTHGIVTNVGDAHLEGFGGRAGVRKGKGELYDFLAANRGVALVNADEEWLPAMAAGVARRVTYQDSDNPTPEVVNMEIQTLATHPNIEVRFLSAAGAQVQCSLQLAGRHNLQNAKTAIAVGKYFKVAAAEIVAGLSGYRPANHRSQSLVHGGVDFLWDAYNANPSSVAAALLDFSGHERPANRRVVLLGEMLELGEAGAAAHRRVVLRAGQVARTVILVGPAMEAAAREFERPWFPSVSALREWFWKQDWAGQTVLVKGSRGNKLERLLD